LARTNRRVFLYEGRRLGEWLPDVVERIVERFDPLRIVLFGSVARGEIGYDSDIDLLVVFPEVKREDKRRLAINIRRALLGVPVPVDVIVADPDEISRRGKLIGTVLHAALQEGEILHERS
jgi:predicted nucleotidyltransferase